jgi:ubiquinone/menaquinone biosynthesis C-methylase UbiE
MSIPKENSMRRWDQGEKLCIFVITILLLFSSGLWSQGKRELARPWERRLNEKQPPIRIMDAIGLKPGMVIGDIGAGKGRFTVWFADRVGEKGRVYANDIVEDYLREIENRCQDLGFSHVVTCLGTVEKPNIPERTLDIAFMINVYHHLDKPVELLKNLAPSLTSEGILVIVEAVPDKFKHEGHATPKEKLIEQADQAGYELEKIETFLEWDDLYFFIKKT